MKNFDLESKIKSVRVPERGQEFWQALPQRILARAQAVPEPEPPPAPVHYSPFLAFGSKLALACLLLGFCLWPTRVPQAVSRALQEERQARRSLASWPEPLAALRHYEHGLYSLVQDPQ